STDDGQTWSSPAKPKPPPAGPGMPPRVHPAAPPTGGRTATPAGTASPGWTGGPGKKASPPASGTPKRLPTDPPGLVQVAFYSNATSDGTFVYERLGADLSPAGTTELKPTAPHDDRVPLVADKLGNTFMAWPPGYPTATRLAVVTFNGGAPTS